LLKLGRQEFYLHFFPTTLPFFNYPQQSEETVDPDRLNKTKSDHILESPSKQADKKTQ